MLLTAKPDHAPVPRVTVRVQTGDVAAGARTITVLSTFDGREDAVRGMIGMPWTGAAVEKSDIAAPFGVDTAYRVESFDVDGRSLGFSASVSLPQTVSGPVPGPGLVPPFVPDSVIVGSGLIPGWDVRSPALIQSPFDPTLAVQVQVRPRTATVVSRKVRGGPVETQTGDLPVFVGQGPLGGRDAPFEFFTDIDGADMLQRITELYPVWLVRTLPPLRVPRVWYVVAPSLDEADSNVRYRGDRLSFFANLRQVASPSPGLLEPVLTTYDIDASYPTYPARDAAYASYTDMDADWSLAGAGG